MAGSTNVYNGILSMVATIMFLYLVLSMENQVKEHLAKGRGVE